MKFSQMTVVALFGSIALSACVQQPPTQTAGATPLKVETAEAPPVPLAGQRLTAPVWQIGDTWQYSDGYGMQVVSVENGLTKFQRLDDPSQWFVNRGLFREKSQSRTALREVVFRSADPAALYGAPVGDAVVFKREYLNNGTLVEHDTSWVIEGTETITVPAGTFDTHVLVMRTRSRTGNWTGSERWWYSPKVRSYVRMEYQYGDAPGSSRVLTSYTVK